MHGADGWGSFSNQINKTGWSFLEVHTRTSIPDDAQAEAAGLIEGYLTAELIWMHWNNTMSWYCVEQPELCAKVKSFLDENNKFMAKSIRENANDPYWNQISLIQQQMEGLLTGYLAAQTTEPLTLFDISLMQLGGRSDIEQAIANRTGKNRGVGEGSCSALVKLLPDNSDLLISHVTWTDFTTMLRIYKLYDLPFITNPNAALHVRAQNHSFPSYPGVLTSGDDFYLLSTGLVTQETTIGNYNKNLWKYVSSSSVMEWMRVLVANRLSVDGRQWVSFFSKCNSGTYNNQWMVLDYNKFTPGQPLALGALWILEQLPGLVEMADLTIHLQARGYWASYNLPYFPAVSGASGVPKLVKRYGPIFDHNLAPRAKIFERDQAKVVDIASMMKLMRYNDYKNDPLSRCAQCKPPYSAENAISARCDLNPVNGTYPIEILGHRRHGATDAKLTNYKLFQKFTAVAVSSPTFDQQPVFQWSTSGWKRPLGHPDKWNFEPVMVDWNSHKKFSRVKHNNYNKIV